MTPRRLRCILVLTNQGRKIKLIIAVENSRRIMKVTTPAESIVELEAKSMDRLIEIDKELELIG